MSRSLIVEADGGSRNNPGPAAYGALVKDAETGEVLAERGEYIGVASNNVAEYSGLVAGLELAREIDPDARIEVRMDSRLVVEQMSGRWKIKHADMRKLADEALAVVPAAQVRYTWIPRAENKDADLLVNQALDAAAGLGGDLPASGLVDDRGSVGAEAEELPGGNALVGWSPDLGTPTTFVLIRHGESPLTAEKRFSGSGGSDPGLTDEGRWQAAVAAEELTDAGRFASLGRHTPFTSIDLVVSSPLRRTRETAEVVAARLGLDVEVEDEVRECAFGAWDGLTYADVDAGWADELKEWLASPSCAPPGGESFDEVFARVSAARARLEERYRGKTVAVVSHVTPIKSFVRDVLGSPSSAMFRMELAPASITVVQWWSDGIGSLRMFNHTAHLATPR